MIPFHHTRAVGVVLDVVAVVKNGSVDFRQLMRCAHRLINYSCLHPNGREPGQPKEYDIEQRDLYIERA
jgi:hypothetical protein